MSCHPLGKETFRCWQWWMKTDYMVSGTVYWLLGAVGTFCIPKSPSVLWLRPCAGGVQAEICLWGWSEVRRTESLFSSRKKGWFLFSDAQWGSDRERSHSWWADKYLSTSIFWLSMEGCVGSPQQQEVFSCSFLSLSQYVGLCSSVVNSILKCW